MTLSVCACGSSKPETKVSEESSSSEESTQKSSVETSLEEEVSMTYPIVEEPIKVTGLIWGGDTSVRSDRLVWNKVSEVTGINIEWEHIGVDALPTYLAGGEWPDFMHVTLESFQVNDYGVIGGRFVNYLDYLDYMPNLKKAFEKYPMAKKALIESNGEMYSLPNIEISSTLTACRPYVRTDVLESLGLQMPKTVEDFYNVLVVMKEKTGQAGFIPKVSNDENGWTPMLFAAFGTLTNMNFDDDGSGKVIFNRTSEQMKNYYKFMNKLYEEGLIHQEYLTIDSSAMNDMAKAGKLVFLEDTGATGLVASDFADGKFHIDCCPPLISDYDNTQEILGKPYVNNYGGFYINKDSEYIEELCRMFDIMYATDEVVEGSGLHGMSFCYGMEGVHWDYGAEGSGEYHLYAPEEYDGAFSPFQIYELIWMNAGLNDALAGLVTDTEGNNRERQIAFVKNVIPYQSEVYFPVGLLKFTEDEQYILDNHLSDIKTYYKEMEGKFITGVLDIETEWDNYCATLEKMCVQDVINVYQASYDRYNAE